MPDEDDDDMEDECDFKNLVRGKYAERCAGGVNLMSIDPTVVDVFPDEKSVNEALRALAGIIRSRTLASREDPR